MPTPVVVRAPLAPEPGAAPRPLEPCNPLSQWVRPVPLEPSMIVAELERREGPTEAPRLWYEEFAVSRYLTEDIVWRLGEERLLPHRATSRVETPELLALGVDDPHAPFALLLSPPSAPSEVRLIEGLPGELAAELTRRAAPGQGVSLAVGTRRRMLEVSPEPFATPPRVEARVRSADGLEVVVIGTEAPRDQAWRVFAGWGGRLEEHPEAQVERVSGVLPTLTFALDLAGERVELRLGAPLAEETELDAAGAGVLLRSDGTTEEAREYPRTALALAGLSFECREDEVQGWRLSNDPAQHEPRASCPLAAPAAPGATPVGQAPYACLTFPRSTVVTGDRWTEVQLQTTVAELGGGLPPASACRAAIERRWALGFEPPLVWARLSAAEGDAFLVLESAGVPFPFRVGRSLDVSFGIDATEARRFQPDLVVAADRAVERLGRFVPTALTVRDAGSSALLLWLGQATNAAALELPAELALERGVEQCATRAACSHVSQFAVRARLGAESRVVPYGEDAVLGGFLTRNLGFEVATAPAECSDELQEAHGVAAELWRLGADL